MLHPPPFPTGYHFLLSHLTSVGTPDTPLATYERATWPHLQRLAATTPAAGIHFQRTVCYSRDRDNDPASTTWIRERSQKAPWFANVLPDFKVISSPSDADARHQQFPLGMDYATSFTSVCINTPLYLSYLTSRCLALGVRFRRAVVSHISHVAALHHAGHTAVVVNCAGLGARTLGGVEDLKMYPIRGQIVLVRNGPGVMADTSGSSDAPDELTYVMQRGAAGGTVLGGCYQPGRWESQPDPELALRIMRRAVEMCPGMVEDAGNVDKTKEGKKGVEALSIVRHGVGLRPAREGGIRVEREKLEGTWCVHQYGHGGAGYQSSFGSAERAVQLVEECIEERTGSAKL